MRLIAILCALPLAAQTIEFNRDIRPILSDRCYTCHGPASSTRVSKLRFDNEAAAKQDMGGHFAISPGDPPHSEMARRIALADKPGRMPPASAGSALTPREIDLITKWIAQGAVWQKHWSFLPPERVPIPEGLNAIDYLVRQRLDKEGLKRSPEADKATLLRRVTFDLTGLPPTIDDIDSFLADNSPQAYGKIVDRLLASPRYGERMAIRWLDAARYADTNGYQTDGERYMWRWRDWVIDAFNRNMGYDQFIVEQIAGDMLPRATLNQKIASAFNRNHRGNGEGGIVPEEYAVEYVVDRVDTTSTVFLGLTVGCARCHDHKYDPIAQREYYQLFSYFNNIPERGFYQKYGNSPPIMKAPTPAQEAELARLDDAIAEAQSKFDLLKSAVDGMERAWELTAPAGAQWFSPRQLDAAFLPDARPFDGQNAFDGGLGAGSFGFLSKFTLAAWIKPAAPDGAILSRMKDEPEGTGYNVTLKNGKVEVDLVLRWLDDAIRVETKDPIALNRWQHIAVTWDGSRYATGVKVYVDGFERPLKVNVDQMNQNFAVKEPFRIGAGGGPSNRFHGSIRHARVYRTALPPAEVAQLASLETLGEIAAIEPAKRTPGQRDRLRAAWLDEFAPLDMQRAWKTLLDLQEERARYYDAVPTVMVMQERETPRDTFLLQRGAYDKPGDKVTRGTPAVLPPLPPDTPNDRLGFARWLVDSRNPLTARVAVNRFWQMYFGTGIVKTVEDFGSQGEAPLNPELLDWLATEFMRKGWDVKALQKEIVMSATYRQSSKAPHELLQRDPENRLLARGPRFRLSAEEVRDQALAVSGLLVEKLGGPSVKPYQPAGLWKELSGGEDYHQDRGESLYRRSLYTFWKRASPPPMMLNFDAPGREACTVREIRTNTPLQALDLMNDVTFVEASRALAQRMMREGGATPAERIAFGFRAATSRQPGLKEREILLRGYNYNIDRFQSKPEAALQLLSQGESPRDPRLNPNELATYTSIASLILNLDETVTRE